MKELIERNKRTEKATLQIIEDSIVFSRFYDGLYSVLNSYAPKQTCHELKVNYNGVETAIILMGVKDEALKEKLSDTYNDYARVRENDLISVPELAQTIYLKWLNEIKNFFLTKKVA